MRPVKKKAKTVLEIEKSIGSLLQEHDYSSVMPDGSLSEHFILSYLTRNNDHAAKGYHKILLAYEKVKKYEAFAKVMQSKRVDEKSLKKLVFFYDTLVRPIKEKEGTVQGSMYVGEIIKLPKPEPDEGEEWKALLHKKERYQVGDKVLYYMKSNIILDNELLHLVSSFTGKLLE